MQDPEARKKEEAQERLKTDPTDKGAKMALKRHSDNSSKFIKIREIFGEDSRYHPNQIIGKAYLPRGGLCQKEPMYRLACKISDLQHLHRTGELAMDPFDFIRWRILKKAASLLPKPGDNPKEFLRSLIYRLSDDSDDGKSKVYQDSVMRQAVLLSAQQRNQLGSYGRKRKGGRNGAVWQLPLIYKGTVLPQRPQSSKLLSSDVDNGPEAPPARAPAPARRIERRARRAGTPPVYAGVNAFRARQQHAQQHLNGDKNSSRGSK
ncbi:hypothetical protein TARUN_2839 [Trichoderma arundinaceum]|uniref:Uncharacterized protein n=1 Tax=Trichoderma arundinaceum TaxID=490622 RepID=A0A395NTV0_TRIAR|nr:hypothetical protein TARUN_2839 [Trichoderma arundinaceum]